MNTEHLKNDAAREFLQIGMANAAKSLAFFMNETVHLNYFDLKLFSGNGLKHYLEEDTLSKNHTLTTELKGDFRGVSYLLFNDDEVDLLASKMLPKSVCDDPFKKEAMIGPLLMELDNIVTASAVTQFANLLQCKLHGDVPSLHKGEFKAYLSEIASDHEHLNTLLFNVRFYTGEHTLEPSFVWLVEEAFFNRVEAVISQEEALKGDIG